MPVDFTSRLLLLAAMSCIRCKHLARSRLTDANDQMISAFCLKGKRIQKKARPPYSWATPLTSFLSKDTFGFLTEMLSRWQQPPFMVPAFAAGTTRNGFWHASGSRSLCTTTNG